MPALKLTVLSLRYSSWSMRPWLVLTQAGARFDTVTVELEEMRSQAHDAPVSLTRFDSASLPVRRTLGSVNGLFPVLRVDGEPIHESLAICEYVADAFPQAGLWPEGQIARARARAICCEMLSGFTSLRGELSSHLFGRVPAFEPSSAARADILRVFEIWREALSRSSGRYLFGDFGIADAMYFPVLGRFRTYGIAIPEDLQDYAAAIDSHPAVTGLIAVARDAPRIPIYDNYLRRLGGDPDAAAREMPGA